jgi:hypothetical protein
MGHLLILVFQVHGQTSIKSESSVLMIVLSSLPQEHVINNIVNER